MALLFNANTERVNHGSDASLDGITAGAFMCWIYINTLAGDSTILVKGESPGGNASFYFTFDAAGDVNMEINRGGFPNQLRAFSSDAPLVIDTWYCLGFHWDTGGAAAVQEVFVGSLTTPIAEVTAYGQQQSGAGALGDAAHSLGIGGFPDGWAGWENKDRRTRTSRKSSAPTSCPGVA